MIVSFEGKVGGVKLREVNTEQEAFAEMRRYLEINQIASNYTEIVWREEKEHFWGTHQAHKEVSMKNSGGYGATFGIYYEGTPRHLEIEPAEKWEVHRDSPFTLYNPDFHYNPTKKVNVCWYDDLANYFEDLWNRMEETK